MRPVAQYGFRLGIYLLFLSRNIVSSYYRGALGVFLVYAINDKQSYDKIPQWLEEVNDFEIRSGTEIKKVGLAGLLYPPEMRSILLIPQPAHTDYTGHKDGFRGGTEAFCCRWREDGSSTWEPTLL